MILLLHQKELWYVIPLFPMFVIFFISALFAETNRPPFDLPEAEADFHRAGYQNEYSGMMYAMFGWESMQIYF